MWVVAERVREEHAEAPHPEAGGNGEAEQHQPQDEQFVTIVLIDPRRRAVLRRRAINRWWQVGRLGVGLVSIGSCGYIGSRRQRGLGQPVGAATLEQDFVRSLVVVRVDVVHLSQQQ